jgi:hypothetical protein
MSLVGGIPTPLKHMKGSWDDYPQYMESHKIDVPNHQPVIQSVWLQPIHYEFSESIPFHRSNHDIRAANHPMFSRLVAWWSSSVA